MAPASNQRFCPVCNRAFVANEAVLRCEGCEVMHHPGCWVTNGGCATHEPHKVTPAAMAYALPPLSITAEGRMPLPFEPRPRTDQPPQPPTPEEVVVGSAAPQVVAGAAATRPAGPKRYVGSTSERSSSVKPMPSIYNRHKILGYWYVPAALILAVIAALGVIWAAEQFRGANDAGVGVAPAAASVAPARGTAAATVVAGATASASGTPQAGGKFKAGDSVAVSGTGDCLNVRSGPARSNDVQVCLADGTALTISDGPQSGDGLTWWKVKTATGEGWVAEDFLTKKP